MQQPQQKIIKQEEPPKPCLGSMRALALPKRRLKDEGALLEEEEEKEKDVR